jgi:hypothetical protein
MSEQVVQPCEVAEWRELAEQARIAELTRPLRFLRRGFEMLMGRVCRRLLYGFEVERIVCGAVDVPMSELKKLIQFVQGATLEEERMLLDVLESFSPAERMAFIKFTTGRRNVPAPGASWGGGISVIFTKLKPRVPPYHLPVAATCTSTLTLPRYPTRAVMAERLRVALAFGGDIVLDRAFDPAGIVQV